MMKCAPPSRREIGLCHSGAPEKARLGAGRRGVGRSAVEVDEHVRVGLQRGDGVPQLRVADGQLRAGQTRSGDERVELEEEDGMEVADPRRHLVDEVVVAGLHGGRRRVAAVVVDEAVGRQHHGRARLLDLGCLQVVGDLSGDVAGHVPHVEAMGVGLPGDVAQQVGPSRAGTAIGLLGLGRSGRRVDVEPGAGQRVARRCGGESKGVGRIAGGDRVVVQDRHGRVGVGPHRVGPGAVQVGQGVDRGGVHPLVDDPHVERVAALPGGQRDVAVVDRVEVNPVLGVLLFDAVADVLGHVEITRPLDRDRQIALGLVGGVGGLIERHRAGQDGQIGGGELERGRGGGRRGRNAQQPDQQNRGAAQGGGAGQPRQEVRQGHGQWRTGGAGTGQAPCAGAGAPPGRIGRSGARLMGRDRCVGPGVSAATTGESSSHRKPRRSWVRPRTSPTGVCRSRRGVWFARLSPRAALPLTALITTRHEYDALFSIYVPIGGGIFVLILLAVIVLSIRYRARPGRVADGPVENNPLEISYAAVIALVVAFLLYLTFHYEHNVDTVSQRQQPVATINVTSAKWEWEFSYPGAGINHFSGTVLRQPLVVPAGEPVRFNLRALDVIHAFWVPYLEYKHDIIPGSVLHLTLVFPNLGLYRGQCAQYCGLRHADMVFNVRVLTPARYAAWIRSHGRMSLT
jgi:cytochrome c oxidase subunit 2